MVLGFGVCCFVSGCLTWFVGFGYGGFDCMLDWFACGLIVGWWFTRFLFWVWGLLG